MIARHYTPYILMEQPVDLQEKTLKFHRDFYDSVGKYKDEKARRICKCTGFPNKTTRSELYIHSIEAGHYPLVQCSKCNVFMEREDTQEHKRGKCDPLAEGRLFLRAMQKKEQKKA